MALLKRRRTTKHAIFLSPAAFARVAAAPARTTSTIIFNPFVLIESSWILGPLNVESESAEVSILKGLASLLCATFTLELYKSISFLNGIKATRRSILQLPKDLKASSNYWCVTFLETLPMKRLIRSIIRECLNHKSNKTILSKLKLQ